MSMMAVNPAGIGFDDVIAAFVEDCKGYTICERCNCPYDRATGRHVHTGSNLCSDLLEKYMIKGLID
ncbi:MAG: hypothetical protein RMJ59_00905 [Candidatus Nitrosocaldus sp.]|nr:hypothetical protein [Candidatus Nitrosocaldus sp.]MDW8274924.1 hypothetical protein [Candidatus Nitrosocaldus sp.]